MTLQTSWQGHADNAVSADIDVRSRAVAGKRKVEVGCPPRLEVALPILYLVSCPIDNFTNGGDFSQDFIGCGGPDEWTRGAVVIGDEGVDPGDQLPGAGE